MKMKEPARRTFRDFDVQQVLEELNTFAVYSKERGGFVRTAIRNGPRDRQIIGELIGSVTKKGYLVTVVCGYHFMVHILVWAAEHGEWPAEDLDHRNHNNKQDNRIENLRLGPPPINNRNRSMQSNSTTGYTGVTFDSRTGLYQAIVKVNRKNYYCGQHDTPEEAYAARQVMIDAHPEWGFTAEHGQ